MIRILLRGNSNEHASLASLDEERMRLSSPSNEPQGLLRSTSLTISYHAICVSTHIKTVLYSSTLSGEEQKRLMNDVHANYINTYM